MQAADLVILCTEDFTQFLWLGVFQLVVMLSFNTDEDKTAIRLSFSCSLSFSLSLHLTL